mmetsp:Transcript_145554/g.256627  ORF Transcript_145554/g.256627 Transcript_145554/m.256627 type:complete len:470 (+) Transcript_145554:98-1507(+)
MGCFSSSNASTPADGTGQSEGPASFGEGVSAPTSAAEAKEALESAVPEVVRSGLSVASKFGLAGSPEYQNAEARLRQDLELPADWDISAFAGGRFLSGASGGRQGSAVIAMQEQPAHVVAEFQALFDATYRKVYTRDRRGAPIPDAFRIISVKRTMNDQVWREYSNAREALRTKLEGARVPVPGGTVTENFLKQRGAAAEKAFPALDAEVNENWLFHGTNAKAAQGIAETDFRLDLSGSNVGTLYGKGVYLAEHVSKSDEYGEQPVDSNGEDCQAGYEVQRPRGKLPPVARESYMLVCRSMLGKVNYTDEARPDPDALQQSCLSEEWDSVLGDRMKKRGTFREIIVYHDDRVYPEFVVKYERLFFHERFSEIYRGMLARRRSGTWSGPTDQERAVLESLWNVYGMPNRGRINKWQLLDLLVAINQPPENEGDDLDETFKEWDTNGDGWITIDEFLQEIITRVSDGIEEG